MSLAKFRKSSNDFDALNSKINAVMNPTRQGGDDDRFWQPSVDKAGNGYAVIRFLPSPDFDADGVNEVPFARVYDHGFKGPGGWYIENSRSSLGPDEADPVLEYNSVLWETGLKANKDIVSGTPGNPGTKRRLHFYSNVLVIEDPIKPENNGKVFLYRYGKKIFDKIDGKMNPKFANVAKVNPFDLENGATFQLRIQKVDGQRNYNESSFDAPTPIATDDAAIEAIINQLHSLKEFTDPAKFKSYDELKAKLDRVLKVNNKPTKATVEQEEVIPPTFQKTSPAKAKEVQAPWETAGEDADDDGDLAQFRALVKG